MDKVIILAAGASSRFWPLSKSHHKAFHKICDGKTIIEATISDLLDFNSDIKEIDLVLSPKDLDLAKEILGDYAHINYFIQETANGEGDAIQKVIRAENFQGNFFLTTGDKIHAGKILKRLRESEEAIAIRKTDEPQNFGIVQLDDNNYIRSVVEKPTEAPSNFKITSGYLLNSRFLEVLEKFSTDHYSLEEALNEYCLDNSVLGVFVDDIEEISLKFPWDLIDINKKQMKNLKGKIASSAKVSESAILEGEVYIGENAVISDFVKIVGPVFIGDSAFIGDFSLIRDNAFIDKNVKIGAHSEIKNSIIYDSATVHRSYIGDSIISAKARIGGGVVFANRRYDREEVKSVINGEKVSTGLTSFGAVIGESVNIGTNATIMPGVKVGENATIWPGKVVLHDVQDGETSK